MSTHGFKGLEMMGLNNSTTNLAFQWYIINHLSLFANNNSVYLPIAGFDHDWLREIKSYNHLFGFSVHQSPIYDSTHAIGQLQSHQTKLLDRFHADLKTLVIEDNPYRYSKNYSPTLLVPTLLIPPSNYGVDLVVATKNKIVGLQLRTQQSNQSTCDGFPSQALLDFGEALSNSENAEKITVEFAYCTNQFPPTPWVTDDIKYAKLDTPRCISYGIPQKEPKTQLIPTFSYDELKQHQNHFFD